MSLDLGDELVARHRGRVDRRPVEPEIGDDRVEVGVGGKRAEVTQGRRAGRGRRSSMPPTSRRRNASRLGSDSRPVMPKSSSAVRPSGRTKRFPPCRSPWKMPWMQRALHAADHARCARPRAVSTPASFMPATSSNAKPSSRSITSTRRRDERRVRPGDHVAALAELGERAARRRACSRLRGGSRAPR